MKKIILSIIFCVCMLPLLYAGDIATFVNLGFSDNSKYFMFAQHGINGDKASVYADLFLVDMLMNSFVKDGKKELRSNRAVEPGDNGSGALFNLLEETIIVTKKYSINHLSRGRILYLLINGETPKEVLQFRDFNTGKKYDINLIQNKTGSGKDLKSSFYIDVDIALASGSTITKKVGTQGYWRSGVKDYKIRQIILAPDEKSLVFLVEKEEADAATTSASAGFNIRYMVETVSIE